VSQSVEWINIRREMTKDEREGVRAPNVAHGHGLYVLKKYVVAISWLPYLKFSRYSLFRIPHANASQETAVPERTWMLWGAIRFPPDGDFA
jgi:hypothetical protein